MNVNLYPTELSQSLSDMEIVEKLNEETIELMRAIIFNTNIEEEVFDVLQMCSNIIKKYNIDVTKGNINHQSKLLKRNHKFIIGVD